MFETSADNVSEKFLYFNYEINEFRRFDSVDRMLNHLSARMKLLFIGDYSNLHACLASELRRQGHEVMIVSDGGRFMKTATDRLLVRQSGLKGTFSYLYELFSLLPQLKGYDHVQLINTNFLSLRPGKLKYVFDILRRNNVTVGLTLAGMDHWYVKACTAGVFDFSEFRIGRERSPYSLARPEVERIWLSKLNEEWAAYLAAHIDVAVSVLPEYDIAARAVFGDKLHFINLPIDFRMTPFIPSTVEFPVRMFIGIKSGMEIVKGTALLLEIAKRLEQQSEGRIEVECVRDLPLSTYLDRMARADLVIDQLYGISPATNALQAMAMGKAVATGVQKVYYDMLGEKDYRPLIALDPRSDVEPLLHDAISDPASLRECGVRGREMVEKHNDVRKVAVRFLKAIRPDEF